ncbi:CU044_2847 family protein [Arthrobacter sp. YAF17]|uniref:CU044_2847 family protein n=1 Tax=Arthrobacter sp. YAF17 TaxID=3233077 RepID=UPI003F8EC7D6
MTEILRYEVGSGTVLVEAADNSFGVERPARNEQGITDAGRRLEDALSAVRPAATAAAEVLKEVGAERLEVQFGVKLAGQAGAIIAQNCSEAHFVVTMSFSHAPAAAHLAHVAPEDEIML